VLEGLALDSLILHPVLSFSSLAVFWPVLSGPNYEFGPWIIHPVLYSDFRPIALRPRLSSGLRGYFGWPMSIDAACALFLAFLTRNLPLQPVTVVISGSPFGLLAETFREGVVISPFCCPILRWRAFPGTFAVFRPAISIKFSQDLRPVRL
jgi:hypothetical protein